MIRKVRISQSGYKNLIFYSQKQKQTNKKIDNFICLSPKLDYPGLRSHLKKDTILYLLHLPPKSIRGEELILAIKIVRMAQGSVATSQACRRSRLSTKESAVYLIAILHWFFMPTKRQRVFPPFPCSFYQMFWKHKWNKNLHLQRHLLQNLSN